ncbi:hypothetical protein [Actinoallomurus rhizosphaericola]|uniref:hypothetical protein n=1 Tax=Actinoallomurus rhizosphaericola TaxID=2952536 RepID=UPI00209200C4|nr:hypothetical protein [Actinoallomurus rhizosphaericola]MCO5999308.1 hypothetical protein [Actinoallomurus rhizosphaericola]
MRFSIVMAGALLGAVLAVTGCRQRIEPVNRDVDISHHHTARAGLAHHRLFREVRHRRPWLSAFRAGATPVPEPAGGRRRPPVRQPNGCATSHLPGHGVTVSCVDGSGDDIDRTHESVFSGSGRDDGDDGDNED